MQCSTFFVLREGTNGKKMCNLIYFTFVNQAILSHFFRSIFRESKKKYTYSRDSVLLFLTSNFVRPFT